MKTSLSMAAAVTLLCAACNTYKSAGDRSLTAVCRGSYVHPSTYGDWAQYFLASVDGKQTLRHAPINADQPQRVDPGHHVVEFGCEGASGPFAGFSKDAKATTEVFFEPRKSYTVKGVDEGRIVRMWMENDETGRRVTPELLAIKNRGERGSPLIVPIPVVR